MTYEARIVSETIDASPDEVYDFARTMENLPLWAAGLAAGVKEEGGSWFAESPMGRVCIAMAPKNEFRVLDHDVTLPDGTTVHNALRVTPSGKSGQGSVVAFVVLRLPGVTDDAFEQDVAQVASDLRALKSLLEQPPTA